MSKIERFLFYVLIFCLPFQTRHIFYQWGNGFNEWTSIYLYSTDLLVILLFGFWFWRLRKERFLKQRRPLKELAGDSGFWLFLFVLAALISLIWADNFWLGFYIWLKLLEIAGFFWYIKNNFELVGSRKKEHLPVSSSKKKRLGFWLYFFDDRLKLKPETTAKVFIASALLQSLIALIQYATQKSLGLKFLAESPLSPDIPGVAKIVVNGLKIIRPYGTFPHSHLLAIFVLTAIFLLFSFWLSRKHSLIKNSLFFGLLSFFVFILWLAFSRSIITAFVLVGLVYFFFVLRSQKKNLAKRIIFVFGLLIIFGSILSFLLWPEIVSRFNISLKEQSVSLRLFYGQTALSIIKEHPLMGVGLGNFVWEIRQRLDLLSPWFHQPVHVLYLLIASETGLLGLVLFLLFIFWVIKRFFEQRPFLIFHYSLFFAFVCFLLIGFFDHFFWTLQQGQMLFWLVLGLMANQKSGQRKNPG